MVFAGLFPTDSDEYPELRDALEKLKLNDAALSYEPETSRALGFGFRCGFLGLLHMDIVRERLEREHDLDLLVTGAERRLPGAGGDGDWVEVHNPAQMPDSDILATEEPFVRASIICPSDHVGAVMELNQERRGVYGHMEYLSPERVQLIYEIPLAEIVLDYYDQLKSRTRGYASFDYDLIGFRPGDVVKVDVLLGRRAGRLAVAHHAPRQRPAAGPGARRGAARADPAADVRGGDPGGDRLARHRPRDGQGQAQGRARQVLRRRHHPASGS